MRVAEDTTMKLTERFSEVAEVEEEVVLVDMGMWRVGQ